MGERAPRWSWSARRPLAGVLALAVVAAGAVVVDPTSSSPAAASPPAPVAVDTAVAEAEAAEQVIVSLEPGADADAVLAGLGVEPAAVVQRYGDTGFALRADAELARLHTTDGVAQVAPDRVVIALGETPGSLERIHVPEAHAAGYAGQPAAGVVRVAIVDTGIDLDHPQLAPNLDASLGVDCTGTGSFDDDHGHGTHVAGTVAAAADGQSVVGVAPKARLVPVKVMRGSGSGTWAMVACGLQHVLDLVTDADPANDVQVVNMSLGAYGRNPTTCAGDVVRDLVCKLTDAGVAVVVAAGNESDDASRHVPAAYPEAITVSATSWVTDSLASFSNYGAGIDLAAPGLSVLSTTVGGGTGEMSGTSMASPAVTGAATVVMAAAPAMSPVELVRHLQETGECPDQSAAGDDGACVDQGTWAGDHDGITEPMVRVDDAAIVAGVRDGFVSPRPHQVVAGTVPVVVRAAAPAGAVAVRVDGGDPVPATSAGDGTWTWSWDTGAVANGAHAVDALISVGDAVRTARVDVVVRNQPLPRIVTPVGLVRGTVPVRVEVSHPTQPAAELSVVLDVPSGTGRATVLLAYDAAAGAFTGSWSTLTAIDGAATVKAIATDGRGRTGEKASHVTVANAPIVTIVAPDGPVSGSSTPIRATASSVLHDLADLTVTWSAGSQSGSLSLGPDGAFTSSWDVSRILANPTTLKVTAKDPDGRTGSASRSVSIGNWPTVRLDAATVRGPADLTAVATSPLHPASSLTVTVRLDGVDVPMPWDGTAHVLRGVDTRSWYEGSVSLRVTAKDPDGRSTYEYDDVDVNNAPVLEMANPAAGDTISGTVQLSAKVSTVYSDPKDATVQVTVGYDDEAAVDLTYDPTTGRHRGVLDTRVLRDGYQTLRFTLTDGRGKTAIVTRSVKVGNLLPVAEILSAPSGPVDGVVRFEVRGYRVNGSTDDLSFTWFMWSDDGSEDGAYELHPLAGYEDDGYWTGMVDTTALPDGDYRLVLQVYDRAEGRYSMDDVEVPMQVRHRTTFGVGAPTLPDGGTVTGSVHITARTHGGRASGNSVWYRVDGGSWVGLHQWDPSVRSFVGSWDTRPMTNGPHVVDVLASDGGKGVAWTTTTVHVRGATPLALHLDDGLFTRPLKGSVVLRLTATDGAVTTSYASGSAWYRFDEGPWTVFDGNMQSELTSTLDTGFLAPGRHGLEVVAVDWFGGFATLEREIVVAPRSGFDFRVASPEMPAGVATTVVGVQVRAVSATRGMASVSVWARVGSGGFVALTPGPDGWFRATLSARSVPVGQWSQVDVIATDWVDGLAYTSVPVRRFG